jgi:HK97 family phage major capsid protein
LYGLPATQAGMNPWGLQVVLSNHCPVANFLVGALRTSTMLYQREGTVIETGYINDDFTKNLVTIRAEQRLGLGVDVPAGIRYGLIVPA